MASQPGNRYSPSHVTLSDPASPTSLFRSLVHYIDDPFYYHTPETDKEHADRGVEHAEHKTEYALVHHRPHRRGMATPSFDVHETTTCFFLEGEFPGIADKKDI